ncbi:hypothetical protein B0O80DRAFT_67808 [Mortierella sp. GBAus27b]|nr:hypothetical protein BGX31_007960 [Mortierella sp. GBA43]KAI8353419.1 hypothetical protein B0O80DRAFT_67808 [Mortierella sp. GBAus27b]
MVRKSKSKRSKASSKATESRKYKKDLLRPSATLVATDSMKAAIKDCIAKVDAIIAECIENNCRFRDQKFDVLLNRTDCLYNDLEKNEDYDGIAGSKRVGDLFKNPVFFLNGAKPEDIKQGYLGDCWFLAALAVVSNIDGLLEKLCVKRDEKIGVYGFIFFKDGDWVSTVVDDQLFYTINPRSFKNSLYFSACKEERETWLPLMEKAYAKIHGDYKGIEGGRTSEGIEDLTGGISSVLFTDDILDTERFWEEMKDGVNKTHLMGCSINYVDGDGRVEKHGIQRDHAYSVLRAVEIEGERLVQIRNPWGTVEWNGDWSDDSDKWTPEIEAALCQKKDDDGQFWMSYKDFLKVFTEIGRCRIFDTTWSVASSWIPYNVEPRSKGKYEFEITKNSEAVFVLTQPDTRFQGVAVAEYKYFLSFHIYDSDNKLVKRSRPQPSYAHRSVNCEVRDLKAGKYTVIPFVRRELNDVKLPEKPEESGSDDDDDSEEVQKLVYLFQERKTQSIRRKSISRKQGRTLLGVDEEDYDEEQKSDQDKWQIMIGLRVYSSDTSARMEGLAGEHPEQSEESKDSDNESTPELVDPESVTATLADKKKKSDKQEEPKSDKNTEKESPEAMRVENADREE